MVWRMIHLRIKTPLVPVIDRCHTHSKCQIVHLGYGTFISPSYPHVYSSEPPQPPTVIYYGDCPACHVRQYFRSIICARKCVA